MAIEGQYNNFVSEFSRKLYEVKYRKDFSSVIFLCIGTDRITGDSFGPLVGYHLKKLYKTFGGYSNVKVTGDLEYQISNQNIAEELKRIYRDFERPLIIVIDSALSKKENVGTIIVEENGMFIGSAIQKEKRVIGDISIKGVVSKNLKMPKYNFHMLSNIPLGLIMNMADITSKGIYEVMKYY